MCQTRLPIRCLIFPQCDLHKRWFFWFGNRSFASLCFWNGPHVDSSKVYKSCLNERRATASKTFKEIFIIGFEQLQPSPHKLFSICITQGLCVLRPKFCLFPRPGQWRWRRGGRLWKYWRWCWRGGASDETRGRRPVRCDPFHQAVRQAQGCPSLFTYWTPPRRFHIVATFLHEQLLFNNTIIIYWIPNIYQSPTHAWLLK